GSLFTKPPTAPGANERWNSGTFCTPPPPLPAGLPFLLSSLFLLGLLGLLLLPAISSLGGFVATDCDDKTTAVCFARAARKRPRPDRTDTRDAGELLRQRSS
ncbi:unnamed protein product, partial [Laminaria digitata]